VFIHIPKCAGTSIHDGIKKLCEKHKVTNGHVAKHWSMNNPGWEGVLYKAPIKNSPHNFPIIISSIRNPWDRMLSYWRFKLKGKNSQWEPDFNKWIYQSFHEKKFLELNKTRFKLSPSNFIGDRPFPYANCVDYLINPETQKISATHILRYENLEEDWRKMVLDLKFGRDIRELEPGSNLIKLPHMNASTKLSDPTVPPWDPRKKSDKPYQEHYTKESREIIKTAFRKDIEAFGYTFDG